MILDVLDGQLAPRLARITNIKPQQIEHAGATGLLEIIPPQFHTAILKAYNSSLRVVFQVGLVLACIAIIGGLGMEWRSVKEEKDEKSLSKGEKGEQDLEESRSRKEKTNELATGTENDTVSNSDKAVIDERGEARESEKRPES